MAGGELYNQVGQRKLLTEGQIRFVTCYLESISKY